MDQCMSDKRRRLDRLETIWQRELTTRISHDTFDLTRLTAQEHEAATRIRSLLNVGGVSALPDADLAFGECLRRKLNGEEMGSCLAIVAASPDPLHDDAIWPSTQGAQR